MCLSDENNYDKHGVYVLISFILLLLNLFYYFLNFEVATCQDDHVTTYMHTRCSKHEYNNNTDREGEGLGNALAGGIFPI